MSITRTLGKNTLGDNNKMKDINDTGMSKIAGEEKNLTVAIKQATGIVVPLLL